MKLLSQLLEQYFLETSRLAGIERRTFTLAGREIAFHFPAGCDVGDITRALHHLRCPVPTNSADLTICVWNGAVPPQQHLLRAYLFTLTNWWFDYTGKRGELLDLNLDGVTAIYDPGTGVLSVLDLSRSMAFYWKADASPVPYYEACSPFRNILHPWLRARGCYFVHGAAVGNADGGVLLVGKGGSGKSTSALACLHQGLQYAGDDYCLVAPAASGSFQVHSLYCTAKLVEPEKLQAFPGIEPHVVNPVRAPGEKVAVSLLDYRSAALVTGLPLRAILVPRIVPESDTAILPCSSREALLALAPSTLSQLPSSGQADLHFLGELARSLPCYRILLGSSLRRIPVKIAELLQPTGAPLNQPEDRFASSAISG